MRLYNQVKLKKGIQCLALLLTMTSLFGCGEKDNPEKIDGQSSINVQVGYQTLAQLSNQEQQQSKLEEVGIAQSISDFLIPQANAVPIAIAFPYFSLVTLEIVGEGINSASVNEEYNGNNFILTDQGHIVLSDTEFALNVPDTVAQTFVIRAYNLDDLRIYRGEGSVTLAQLQQAQVPLQIAMEIDIDEGVAQLASDPGCSGDADNDGICNEFEDLFLNAAGEPDVDNDSIINSLDDDSDGDGILDIDERSTGGVDVLGKTDGGGFPFFINFNQAPTISGTPSNFVQPGELYSFTPTVNDPEGDTVTYQIINQPSWAVFDELTGTLSGTPSTTDRGAYPNISISVSDWQLSASLPIFAIQVGNNQPVITLSGSDPVVVTVGSVYTEQGATASDVEDDNTSLTNNIVIGGDVVDTSTVDVYTVTYDVTDSLGAAATQVVRTVYVVPPGSNTKTWFGATTDWNDDNNWYPPGVPTVADHVYIPASAQQTPVLTASSGVNDLIVEAGASINTAGFTLMVAGNADVNGAIIGATNTDIVRMTGTGVTLEGTFPNLQIDGVVSISGPTTVNLELWIFAQGSNLILNGNTVTVNGQFEVNDTTGADDAILTMTNPADTLIVGDTIRFHGGDTNGTITEGVIIARGNAFFQNFNPTAYSPSGNHRIVFNGSAQQNVTLFNSAADNTGSHFNIVEIDNPEGVNFNNNTHFNATPTIINGQITSNANTTSFLADTINDSVGDRWLFTNTYFNGSPTTLPPSITSNVRFNGNTVLNADLNINGALAIYEQGANLTLNGNTVTVSGDFRTQNTTGTTVDNDATLTMTDPNDVLDIGGEARFLGGDTSGLLTDGVIYLAGYFWQNDNAASFSASGNHRVVLDGATQQNIRFQNFGAAATASHFQYLEIRNGSTIQVTRNIFINGELVIDNTVTPLILATADRYINTTTTTIDGAVFENVQLRINSNNTPVLNNTIFQNFSPTVTQLSLTFDNVTTAFNNLTFNSLPTTGRYINGSGASTITLTNATPGYGIPKTNVANGFVLNWGTGIEDSDGDGLIDADELNIHNTNPVLSDTDGDGVDDGTEIAAGSDPLDPGSVPSGSGGNKQWIGGAVAALNDWSNADNWSPAGVPNGTHDVTIPGAAANQPILSSNVMVNNLVVESGATLETAGFTITATGNVDGGNTITGTGTVIMTGVDATLRGTLPNVLIEGTVGLSATTNVNGEVRVRNAGRLNLNGNQLAVTGNFLTDRIPANNPDTPALIMQNANDQLTVTGNVRFWAGDMTGLLTDGIMAIAGDLSSGNAGTVFAPTGNHRVILNGTVQQNVGFVSPGYGASEGHLNILEIQNPVRTHFTGNAYINTAITVSDTAGIVTGGFAFLADTLTINAPTDRWEFQVTTFDGSPSSLPVSLTSNVIFTGTTTLNADFLVNGYLYVEGLSANLNLNGNTVAVNGNFETRSTNNGDQDATLTMANPADILQVNGNVAFRGGNTNGLLTAGTLSVSGNFNQINFAGSASTSSFAASGTHTVVLNGTAQQSVQFNNPGAAANLSHFQNIDIQNPVGLLASGLFVNGRTTVGPAVTPLIEFGNHRIWTTVGVDIDGLIVDNTLFNIVGADIVQFDNVTFQNQAPTVNPLTLNFSGVTATFSGLTFNTLPNTTNYYIVGDGASTITLTNAIPGYGIPRTSVSNGFVINWGAGTEDTDGDGLTDADELNTYNTNPVLEDTDGDGVTDGDEVAAQTDPLDPSSNPLGAPVTSGSVIDFDLTNGGFWTPGTLWQFGAPTSGPGAAHNGDNVWATNLSGNYFGNETEALYLPPIDLTAATDPTLSFRLWAVTDGNDGLTLEAYDGISWNVVTFFTPDYDADFNNDPAIPVLTSHRYRNNYIWSAVSLSQYVGQTVQLRLIFRSNSPDNRAGFYIDEVRIDEESTDPDTDGVVGILNEYTDTRTDPFVTDTDADGFDDGTDIAPRNPANNQSVVPLTVGTYIDFENDDGGFVGRGRFIGGNGDLGAGPTWTLGTLWEWGPPTAALGPAGAYSGNNVWGTNLAGNYFNRAREGLMFPPIDLTGSTAPVLTFRLWAESTDFDGVKIQIYNRTLLGWENPAPDFPAYDNFLLNDPASPGWSNQTDGNNGYVLVSVPLVDYVATQQPVILRLQFNSNSANNSRGIYIDDISISQ